MTDINKTRHVEVKSEPRDEERFLGSPNECPRCLGDTENEGLCDYCQDEVDL